VAKLELAKQTDEAVAANERQMFDPAVGELVTTRVVLRDSVQTGQTVAGPAAITEDETTIIVPSSRRAIRQPDGCIDMLSTNQRVL
jgi:N-methylhydantoinase A